MPRHFGVPDRTTEPRRFRLTKRRFMIFAATLVLAAVAAFGMWARHSIFGVIALGFTCTIVVGGVIAHRLAAGHWIDEGP